jgi:hypothetical protein
VLDGRYRCLMSSTPEYPPVYTEDESYGIGLPQPYPTGVPEEQPRNANTNALSSSLVVFSGQGRLMGWAASSTKASGQFILMFDANSVPATGAVPIMSVDIATATAKGAAYTPGGRWFRQGCVLVNSTTQGSLTIGAADCLFDAQYVPQVI